MRLRNGLVVTLLLGALAMACSSGPKAIVVGRDQCAHCKMAISDLRFAAQYVTEKGKRFTFDSIECLVHSMQMSEVGVRSAWVADYEMEDRWVPVESAVFVHSDRIHSPMGAGLAAFGPPVTPAEIYQAYGGTVLTWFEVKARLEASPIGAEPAITAQAGS
ncbi:MAG TPA: nitrous oxide reductase accessory protein NosL [Rhodothermales bacterium]|nr:nitrous oxide reductase accessory protein NosL [Rhodothermales bacterium]